MEVVQPGNVKGWILLRFFHRSDPESYRSSKKFLRAVFADGSPPSEREDVGLQSVFTSVFPIQDFRGLSQLDFVDYAIGNWECKCGYLRGLHHLRATCRNCGAGW